MAQGGDPMDVSHPGTTCSDNEASLKSELRKVEENSCSIEDQIRQVEKEMKESSDDREKEQLWEEEKQLRQEKLLLMKEQNRLGEILLMKEEERLREMKLLLLKKEQPPTDSKRIYFQVDAKIIGAKRMKGMRAAVYRHAQEHVAWYSLNHSRSIWYEEGSEDLQIALLFGNEEGAYRFRTFLDHWCLNNPLAVKWGDVVVGDEIATVHIPSNHNLRVVRLNEYVAETSDSPAQSILDFTTLPSSVSSEITYSVVSDMDDPLYKYQCLERPQEFFETSTKPYRWRIKPKAKFAELTYEVNNQLAGTWLFHQWFDGVHTFTDDGDDIPILAIWPVTDSIQNTILPGPPPVTRSRVDILVEFRDSSKAMVFEERLKEGSKRIDDKKLQTFVLVSDPALFCDCLQWKYEDTIKKWNGEDEDSLC